MKTKDQIKLRLERFTPKLVDQGELNERIQWMLPNGKKHRDFGPAIVFITGKKLWYQHGRLHREGGPAIESTCGMNSYYLNGIPTSKKKAVKF